MARFYGALKEKTGEVTEWPSAEESRVFGNVFKRSSSLFDSQSSSAQISKETGE